MALSPETKEKLQRRIDELKKRMLYDANDLDYETHLNQVRELQKIISAAGKYTYSHSRRIFSYYFSYYYSTIYP